MTTTIQIASNFSVEIMITDVCVFVTTIFNSDKRTTDFTSVQDCIENTTMPAVRNYLKSL